MGTRHRTKTQKDEQHRPHLKNEMKSGVLEGKALPVSYETPTISLIVKSGILSLVNVLSVTEERTNINLHKKGICELNLCRKLRPLFFTFSPTIWVFPLSSIKILK